MLKMTDILNVASHAGRDVGRYAVNGVYVDKGGTVAATDSRRMARIIPKEADPRFETAKVLNLSLLKMALPKGAAITSVNGDVKATTSVPRNEDEPLIENAVPNRINGGKGGYEELEIVGDFPDHKRIYPQGTDYREDCEMEWNPQFVLDAMKGVIEFYKTHGTNYGGTAGNGVTFRMRDKQSAVVFRAEAADGAVYESLVMPITKS